MRNNLPTKHQTSCWKSEQETITALHVTEGYFYTKIRGSKGLIDGGSSEEPCSRSKTWQGKATITLFGRLTQITMRAEHWFNPSQLKRYLCVCVLACTWHTCTYVPFWCGGTYGYMCVYMAMIQPNLVKKIFWCMCLFGVGVHVGTCVCTWYCSYVYRPKDNLMCHLLLRQGLLLSWTSPRRLSWLTCKAQGSVYLPPQGWGLQTWAIRSHYDWVCSSSKPLWALAYMALKWL